MRKKCSCSFSAIVARCYLPGTLQLGLVSWQPWEHGSCSSNVVFWGAGLAPGWAERGGKLLQVGSLQPCEYMSSGELAVSGQGKAAAAKRKLPSCMKGWREVDWMTVKGRVWVENVLAVTDKCAAP